MDDRPSLRARVDAVKARLPIATVVDRHVKLSGSARAAHRRGPCPFCQGTSASFSLRGDAGHCFRCSWHGHVVDFLAAVTGLSFLDALIECEIEAGIAGEQARRSGTAPVRVPLQRDKAPTPRRARKKTFVDSLDMARVLWRLGRPDPAAVRRYFVGRGVPPHVLSDDRLAAFRFAGLCPIQKWEVDAAGKGDPRSVLQAPAIMALVREPRVLRCDVTGAERTDFIPTGLHVTFLNPAGTGTMTRRKPWAAKDDPDPLFPKRKMLGPIGRGCIVLGDWHADAPLWVGEGNETVLSGMALGGAGPGDVGVAALSLDTLQGFPRRWKNGALPLHSIEPDPDRPCLRIPGQRGSVTVLVDGDTGALARQKLVECKGGPLLERTLTGAERARICAELAVKGWRAAGVPARAVRAPLGMDFNDVLSSACGGVDAGGTNAACGVMPPAGREHAAMECGA